MKINKTITLLMVLGLVFAACSSGPVPCDEVEISTGENLSLIHI